MTKGRMYEYICNRHRIVTRVEVTGLDVLCEVFAEYFKQVLEQELEDPDERYSYIPKLDKAAL